MSIPHRISLSLLALVLVLAARAPDAAASHYRLHRISLVDADERRALSSAGISDTRALLSATAQLSNRVWLARTTGIPLARLAALATQCDLLRVKGLGPSMMGVLQDAGIQDTRALGRAATGPLLKRMRAATVGTRLHHQLPSEAILATWVAQARRMPVLLADIPEPPTTEPAPP